MSRIHIARNHQRVGQFSAEDVAEGLQTGKFLPSDLGWREPMETWLPLSQFTDLPEVPPPVLTPPPVPETLSEVAQPSWERRVALGFFPALFQTIQQVFANPVTTFQGMTRSGGLGGPLWFYTLLLSFTTWVAIGYQMIVLQMNPDVALGSLATQVSPAEMQLSFGILIVLTPLFAIVGSFIWAGIVHLALVMLGSSGVSFEVTFRAVCYAAGTASILQLIPMCGGLFYFTVSLLLLSVALRETHRIDTLRSSVAVIVPALVCCGLFFGLYGAMAALAAAQAVVK